MGGSYAKSQKLVNVLLCGHGYVLPVGSTAINNARGQEARSCRELLAS